MNKASGGMKTTVAGFARIQNLLNSCESSYKTWYVFRCSSPKGRIHRCGTIVVAVLACLSLVLALTLAALQTALRMRREVTMQHLVSHTSLLCETGIARAAYRKREPDYAGETWRPLMPELAGKQAEVTIVFLERSPTHTKVQVTAVIEDSQSRNNSRVQRSLIARLVHESQNQSSKGENP